jgi:hypothetical protein
MSDGELTTLKSYLENRVAYAKYYSGGTGYKIDIYKTDILSDGRFAVYLLFDHTVPNQIDKIEFYNVDGTIFASGTESINKESFTEGVLYRYTIKFTQTAA